MLLTPKPRECRLFPHFHPALPGDVGLQMETQSDGGRQVMTKGDFTALYPVQVVNLAS